MPVEVRTERPARDAEEEGQHAPVREEVVGEAGVEAQFDRLHGVAEPLERRDGVHDGGPGRGVGVDAVRRVD